jgi:two-component system, chemotaxis family, CheB/CheR fusion protein
MSFPEPPIVGIGASVDGMGALETFFASLPDEPNAAFVVVNTLNPEIRGRLITALKARTKMRVAEVEHTAQLQINRVYVIAPDRHLAIVDRAIVVLPLELPRAQRAPLDHLFRVLAARRSEGGAYAIVLTDAGADAAMGIKAIKGAGGIVLVQQPDEAGISPISGSGIAAQMADFVLPVQQLAGRLVELLNDDAQKMLSQVGHSDAVGLTRILALLRIKTGHDFTRYKQATVLRRIGRRMQVTRRETLSAYHALLREESGEAQALFSDLLISVTTFFRDPEAFDALTQEVIPQLFVNREPGESIRVWVPGCATGEEAYSIGMVLLEYASRREMRVDIQIFASDLDAAALDNARQGRYPVTIEADVSEERLRRFFQYEGDRYQVRSELRDTVMFASHSILKDPPFSRLDLVSCRNLLIYLEGEQQEQSCHTFHYALNPGGFLFLGSAETADQPAGLFKPLNREARLYRSAAHRGAPRLVPVMRADAIRAQPARAAKSSPSNDLSLHLRMLEQAAPPSMLVDQDGLRVLHLSESAGRFLQLREGPIMSNALDVVREELRHELEMALRRVFGRGVATLSIALAVRFNEAEHRVYLQVKPVNHGVDPKRYALVLFIEGEALEPGALSGETDQTGGHSAQVLQRLQEELQVARNRLRLSREESSGTTEELQAANEELRSINEEFRSTSEELETSKQELQSMNEELHAVNSELRIKLEGISRAHSDLQNLMAATDFGTLFLDPALCIKRFTPRLTELFNITSGDEGRPITDLTHRLEYDGLADAARTVLSSLVPLEYEVHSRSGRWYSMRIRPYRTIDDRIDGVVATFVDMTALREAELRLETLVQGIPQLVWRAVDNGLWTWASPQWTRYTGQSEPDSRAWGWLDPLHVNDRGLAREAWSHAVERGGFEVEVRIGSREMGSYRWFQTRATPVRDDDGKIVEWLGTCTDIHDLRLLQEHQKVLVGELQHRTRNLIGVVRALSDGTVNSSVGLSDFHSRFSDRLKVLMRVQGLLSRLGDADRVVFDELIESELTAVHGSLERVTLEGPTGVRLRSSSMQTLAMALHELATNAVKYGALGQPQARLEVRWQVVGADGGGHPRLHIDWRERDVNMPAADAAPQGSGQGRELIEAALPYQLDAVTSFVLEPDGLHCTIVLPVSNSNLQPTAA